MNGSKFDQPIAREHTCSVKFDARKAVFGREDVIPAWVADMDFPAPEAVTRALTERAQHLVYGYTLLGHDRPASRGRCDAQDLHRLVHAQGGSMKQRAMIAAALCAAVLAAGG